MILNRISEGGPFFMVPIVLLLIVILLLIIKGLLKRNENTKTISLISSISLFVLVWGLLGQAMGLIQAFDAIQSIGNVSVEILAGGLKVTFLPIVFAFFTFLVGRAGIIVLTILEK
jgi:cytochrome c biogenesis factor